MERTGSEQNKIVVEENTSAFIRRDEIAGSAGEPVEILLKSGARLSFLRIQNTDPESTQVSTVHVVQERDSFFNSLSIEAGGIFNGNGINGTIIVRKVSGGIGVEKTYPVHLPSIDKVDVVRQNKVRRAKLYYLRDKSAREIRKKIKASKAISKKEGLVI